MRVRVHAVIWVGDLVVVHHERRRGKLHITLPGGRVTDRESVVEALTREVYEELGFEVEVGALMCCAEVVSAASHHEIELVFAASPVTPIDAGHVDLVDPRDLQISVFPLVLGHIAEIRDGAEPGRWLGNLYDGRIKGL